ncbi:MAG: DUF2164 domain-containing protein [Candidatus Eisenbacteria bacterium]|uniref:DUF2164 domain-containing protein n=1 Tax=Eiseniibacteriota bacterium TaxID=2212470 RepID=A0A956M2W5_UNCEI|nr:DUF2164 domain-containing protein [Candidatus Eisenbacteria bacterium]
MPIELPKEARERLQGSLKKYFQENMEEEIGDLKAMLMVDFFLREIGPSVYNQAISDAQSYLNDRVADLDGVLHQPEFGYWKK